ncbi:thermosome subunit alpha [Halomarina pelagica]|uniref:thermosome subunit alpha n=1 Tax=Halomarina pelagica TaxID=2961599 RepID=UPI0020C34E24|nr:thermosome subunit alpha [Halomarina sp. BND7]
MTQGGARWPRRLRSGGLDRTTGRDARRANVAAGRALAATLRTTLGPAGRDKLLVGTDGLAVVTNDGASILDRMEIEHPAASLLYEVASEQAERVGDGTTTAVLLAGALLEGAEGLFEQGVHPGIVTAGYHHACSRALETLSTLTLGDDPTDRATLVSVARTAITGKWSEPEATRVADLAADAVLAVSDGSEVDRHRITLQGVPGGSPGDAEFVDGLVVDMGESSATADDRAIHLPRRFADARIALVDAPLGAKQANATRAVTVEGTDGLDAIAAHEERQLREQLERIADAGTDAVFCQQAIDDVLRSRLARRGILAVERTRQDEMYKLARATGGTLVASVEELTPEALGRAGVVERRRVAGRDLTVVRGNPDSKQVSLLLRGGTQHAIDETRRLVEDCLTVVTLALLYGDLLPGGGATEAELAADLRGFALEFDGREQLAIEAAAGALETVPRTLAENAGASPIDALADLRASHDRGEVTAGIDAADGSVADVSARGVVEPLAVKRRAIAGATEAANLLLRIDDVVAARDGDARGHDHDHDHGIGGDHGGGQRGGYPWAIGH